jgi:hypothetical protein
MLLACGTLRPQLSIGNARGGGWQCAAPHAAVIEQRARLARPVATAARVAGALGMLLTASSATHWQQQE